jgi:adenylate cyclase
VATDNVTRRLAAILAADVVGYSRLIRSDEEGTLAALKAIREDIINPKVAEHHGRIVKLMGDGMLAEFGSVVDAVRNAVATQEAVAEYQADVPKDHRIIFRVGINLGDVVIDGDDIHGDGVNVAARLEALSEPGGICISSKVYEEVRDRIDLAFDDLGEQRVKNIDRPVRVWRWSKDATVTTKGPATASELLPLPDKPSIAVLPFDNMSGDPEQEYFADGIAEDIITDISQISGLFVIARNSSFSYKGRSIDAKTLARELGVRFVLEGSVRKAANRVRITAQLIDGTSGGHLWAERFDRDLEDVFAIQDEITTHIVRALKVELDLDERERVGGRGTNSIEAYDIALRARNLLFRHTPETNDQAQSLYEQSIALDPEFGIAHAELAITLFTAYIGGWNKSSAETLERGYGLAAKAVELDPTNPQVRRALALGNLWKHDLEQAVVEIDTAVEFGPNSADALASRGYILSYASRPAEAISSLKKAMELNPQFTGLWLHFLGHAHFIHEDYEAAASVLEQRIRREPETDISRVLLAACYGHLGRDAEAMQQWAEVRRINSDYSIERKAKVLPYKDPADWKRFIEGLRKAGLPV